MSVEFYKDKKSENRWHIVDDGDVVHACHEGFRNEHGALQNLFINHAMMSIFVAAVAQGGSDGGHGNVYFEEDADHKIRWKIKANNGEPVGVAHKGFNDMFEAMDNLIITYTMLTVFVAEMAQVKSAVLEESEDGNV